MFSHFTHTEHMNYYSIQPANFNKFIFNYTSRYLDELSNIMFCNNKLGIVWERKHVVTSLFTIRHIIIKFLNVGIKKLLI